MALLWKQSSGYASACFDALGSAGVDVLVTHRASTTDAPYDDELLGVAGLNYRWLERPDERALRERLETFRPDAMLVVSWDVGAYRRIARSWRGRTLRILCMDNAWLGTTKQWAGRLASPLLIRPTYDAAYLPGDRQAEFARYLGFGDERILWGFYTCDEAFARVRRSGPLPKAFLFVGRLVADKGVDVLATAYQRYRDTADQPWPLLVCGDGPVADQLAGRPGVEMFGFVQPDDLPEVYQKSGCLILPSRFEPWGVAIHEAASAGLAVVASTACGATTRLVLDGYNGLVVPPGRPGALATALSRIADLSPSALTAMGVAGSQLAQQFTPARWASYLVDRVTSLREELGLADSR